MINPISSTPSVPEASHSAQPAASPSTSNSPTLKQDTVSLSPQGQAASASADVDHDGDSH